MSFINKLIKKGTFYFIFVFLFFVFFGQSKAFALTCTTKELNDKSEYLVLNARSAWSDTGVKIICDGREQENIIVKTETINGTTSEKSTQYGSNIINSVVSKPGFYKVTYSLESDPTVMVVRQIRVLPNNLNDAIVTWNGDTDSLNTAENDEFIRIENVAGNGYLVIGNFGGAAFIAKYNLIGQLQWSFNCKSEDWFFAGLKVDGTQVTKDAVESVELTDLIKTAAATVNTDFYISGTYTLSASGVKKGFVRRINISTDGLSIVSSSNGFVSFDEFTKINRIKLSTQYILAVGYLENSDGTTKGKIARATIVEATLGDIQYYTNDLNSLYNSLVITEDTSPSVIAVGRSDVLNQDGAKGGYITSCNIANFENGNGCESAAPYYYLTYNGASGTQTEFSDIVSHENGYVVIGKSKIDRVRGITDSYGNTLVQNILYVSLNNNLGIIDAIIKGSNLDDSIKSIRKTSETEFIATGQKNGSGYYATIEINDNGALSITEGAITGTEYINDINCREGNGGEINKIFVGSGTNTNINDIAITNNGNSDAFLAIIDSTEFGGFDNISLIVNQEVCSGDDKTQCSGEDILDEYKMTYGDVKIGFPVEISSKEATTIQTFHKFQGFNSLVNFIIGRSIIVVESDRPDNASVGELGIDKWYLYNRTETTKLDSRTNTWSDYYYPVDNGIEKKSGVTYYVLKYNTSTKMASFEIDESGSSYTNSNYLKHENESYKSTVAFQGEEKAKEYAILQEYARIALVNEQYTSRYGTDTLKNGSDSAMLRVQRYYFIYYIDLKLENADTEVCSTDANGKIYGDCTNQNGYAFASLKSIKRVIDQIVEMNGYFVGEQNVRYTSELADKPSTEYYNQETTTILYTKEISFELKNNASLIVSYYPTQFSDNEIYFSTAAEVSEIKDQSTVTFNSREGKYVVKYCYYYNQINEICGESATFVIDRTAPFIKYQMAGEADFETITPTDLKGKSASRPYLISKDISIQDIFDADPYAYIIANTKNGVEKFYLQCNANINDGKCIRNLEEYIKVSYEYDIFSSDSVYSINVSDRAGNITTFYFKIGTQMMEVNIEESATTDKENSFILNIDIYGRNDFESLVVQYVKSASCTTDCTEMNEDGTFALFGEALSNWIRAIVYKNNLEIARAKESEDRVIDESNIEKKISLLISASTTLSDGTIGGGVSIPEVTQDPDTKEYFISQDSAKTFKISKGLYSFVLVDSFENVSKSVGGIGIERAELDIYINSNEDETSLDSLERLNCSGESCEKQKLPTFDEDKLSSESGAATYFKGIIPNTYLYQDLIPTTLYNGFNKDMFFTSQFIYIRFAMNEFGVVKISIAKSVNSTNNYITNPTLADKTQNLKCMFAFHGNRATVEDEECNSANFTDLGSLTNDLKDQGIYFLGIMEDYYYLAFTKDGTYHVSSEVYIPSDVEAAENLVTLPIDYSFVIDTTNPNITSRTVCENGNECKGEKSNFNTDDFIYDENGSIINIGNYGLSFNIDTELLGTNVINRLLVMKINDSDYYNPYACALGKCDESIKAYNVEFDSQGKYLTFNKSGKYIITFVDQGGNKVTFAFVIDKEAPTVDEVIDINNKNLNEYQQYIEAKITISENSFLTNKPNENMLTVKYWIVKENATESENAEAERNAISLTFINDNGNCTIGTGDVVEKGCTLDSENSLSVYFVVPINKVEKQSSTNVLNIVATDYFNNSTTRSQNFIFDNEKSYIYFDDSYTPTTKFGEEYFDDYEDKMLSMSANASLDTFKCDMETIVAETGKIICRDEPTISGMDNKVVVEAYEAYRVTYNNYIKDRTGYVMKENYEYVEPNVKLYKENHSRYTNRNQLEADIAAGAKVYTKGKFIKVSNLEQIDPNIVYYYDKNRSSAVDIKDMYTNSSYYSTCSETDMKCALYKMYDQTGTFTNTEFYTYDSDGYEEVELANVNTSNYSNYYYGDLTPKEDNGRYLNASTLENSCVVVSGSSECIAVKQGRIKLIDSNVKYYNIVSDKYRETSNYIVSLGSGIYGIEDNRVWQVAVYNSQNVKFGFGLVSSLGRPIIFGARDGAGNYSVNYIETVIIIKDEVRPSIVDIAELEYRVDMSSDAKTLNNYELSEVYYQVNGDLLSTLTCEENTYFKRNGENYESVNCGAMDDNTQYYVKIKKYVPVNDGEDKVAGKTYYVRSSESLKDTDGKYKLTSKNLLVTFSEPIYKIECKYYLSIIDEERNCSFNATEFDYRENKTSFELIYDAVEEENYYVNYTLTVYDFSENQTTINYLFIDREKPNINFYDNISDVDRIEANYKDTENIASKYNNSYITSGYSTEVQRKDKIDDRINSQGADTFVKNQLTYEITYYAYKYNVTFNNYIKNGNGAFVKVNDGEIKNQSDTYYTLMKKIDGFIFRGDYTCDDSTGYCYVEDYFNYYPSLLSNSLYWEKITEEDGNIAINQNAVGVYKIEYIFKDLSGNISDTLIKSVYVVDTIAPTFNINGKIVNNLSGYYNGVEILFSEENEGIYQVYYCIDSPETCVLPTNIFAKATGKLQTEIKNIKDIGGAYNYTSQSEGIYKFYVYDKGSYNTNVAYCEDCENNSIDVMYLKYNYSSHQFIIDITKPRLEIDANVDESTNKLFYVARLGEDAKLYCAKGDLRGDVSFGSRYIECQEILEGSFSTKETSKGYDYIKTNNNGEIVYKIEYTRVPVSETKYFYITYYAKNDNGSFSEYPMGYDFSMDETNVYKISAIEAYIREDGGYVIMAEDKATNSAGRVLNGDFETYSRIDVDNTAPTYNKLQNLPTGASYWYSVPVDVISNSNVNTVMSALRAMNSSEKAENINVNTALNSNLFYAFATKKQASDYLYSIYAKHIEENARECGTNKWCYSYYDIRQGTFINNKEFSSKAMAVAEVTSNISTLVIPTYGGDKLFDSSDINQRVCSSAESEYCTDNNMYKTIYLKKNSAGNMSIEESCDSSEDCIEVNAKIIKYYSGINITLEIKDVNTLDTQLIRYYQQAAGENSGAIPFERENETFTLALAIGNYYIFEEIDEEISYINSKNSKKVTHSNKSYYAIYIDDNSYLDVSSREEKDGVEETKTIYIDSGGNGNDIKTNSDAYYLIIKKNAGESKFNQKYEIFDYTYVENGKTYTEYYSYLRISRTVVKEYNLSEKVYENINDYLKIDEATGEYYFEIPVGILSSDDMETTIELIDRAGNITRIIVSKSQKAPTIELNYQGEGKDQTVLVTIVDTWNTITLSESLDAKWSKDGITYNVNEDIIKSLKCSNTSTDLTYGCVNTGSVNNRNSYSVRISNVNYTYGFFEIYLTDDHNNTNSIKFIYNPYDFSINYSTDDSASIKYIDNNTFIDEEQRMITKGNLILEWNDIINYINLYKMNNGVWDLVCTSSLMNDAHAGKCSEMGNSANKIEANFTNGIYANSRLTYTDEGIYKAELVNRQSILIHDRCVDSNGEVVSECKEMYTSVSAVSSWEVNEAECEEALQIKRQEMTNQQQDGRRYTLFEVDKTLPITDGINITVNKPTGTTSFTDINDFLQDQRQYTNSEVLIEWSEKLVVLKWTCNYNLTMVIKEIDGELFVVWTDNGNQMSVKIANGAFSIGQTYYTITKNGANQDIVTWNEESLTKSTPITTNANGEQTFKLLSPCQSGQTLFNGEKAKMFTINSKNDVIYSFYFEDFAGNILENSEYKITITINLPEIEIYEVDADGNFIEKDGNLSQIRDSQKVRNNVKLVCYEDSILLDDCSSAYVVELLMDTVNGYVKREPSTIVKETYGRMNKYKFKVYVRKDNNGSYYPSLFVEIEFIIDKQPPKIIVNGETYGEFNYYKGNVIVSIDDTVNGLGIIYGGCVLSGDNYVCNETPITTFTSSYELKQTGIYKIVARDEIGNETIQSDIKYIIIDNDNPDITVTANNSYMDYELAENSYTNVSIVYVNALDNYPGSYLKYRINDGEWITVQAQSMQFSEEGIYEVKAFDTVGNESIERHFIIYRQSPKYQLFVDDKPTTTKDIIKGDAYLTWTEPTNKAEAPIVKVTLNGYDYKKKQKITDTGEYMFVLTDLAGNTTIYKITINKSDKVCLNGYSLKPLKQYLLQVIDGKVILNGDESFKFSKDDTIIFATPTNQYRSNSECSGLLGYRSIDSKAYILLKESEAEYINTHTETTISLDSKYQSIIDNSDGFVYAFVVSKSVAKKNLGMSIGENFFNKDPLGWSLLFLAGAAIIYGFGKVVIFRKKVKVLK